MVSQVVMAFEKRDLLLAREVALAARDYFKDTALEVTPWGDGAQLALVATAGKVTHKRLADVVLFAHGYCAARRPAEYEVAREGDYVVVKRALDGKSIVFGVEDVRPGDPGSDRGEPLGAEARGRAVEMARREPEWTWG